MGLQLRLFKKIPYLWATLFATALAVVQLLEHTDLLFAVCCFIYILIATAAFNFADGLSTLAGNFIFGNAVLTCILGVTAKAVLGEPGQSNLKAGDASIEIYVLGMLGMLGAVIASRQFRTNRPLLPTVLKIQDMDAAFLGCAIVGLAADLYYLFFPMGEPGSISALFAQLNQFTSFAIILGTIQAVRKSHGRHSLSPFLIFLLVFGTAHGFLTFSKQGMFVPVVAWIIGMFASDYRLRLPDLAILVTVFVLMVRFGVPFSQYGRNFRPEEGTAINALPQAIFLLENFDLVDQGYGESKQAFAESDSWRYYSKDLGQMERLTMLPPDDTLIDFTDRGHFDGFAPTKESFENLIPHFIWKDKPRPHSGNMYWHELGMGAEDDNDTGISFSVTADAYHQGGLVGVLVLEPVLLCAAFLLWSFVLGGTRQHPGNLVVALTVAHIAPEGGVNSVVSQTTLLAGVIFIAWLCRYIFPVIGSILQRRLPGIGRRSSGSDQRLLPVQRPITDNRQARSLG